MNYFLKLTIEALAIITVASALITHAATAAEIPTQYYDHNLSKGVCDQKVQDLQIYLAGKGYIPNDYANYITGYFGTATFKAVKKMQSDNGIRSTGIVGPQTRAFLNVEFNKQLIADENARQEQIRTNPNYHATGLLRTAKCIYDKIPVAPLPATN